MTIREVVVPVSIAELASELPEDWSLDESDPPLELSWCRKYFVGGEPSRRHVLVTCHECESLPIGQLVRFYVLGDEGYDRALEIRFGEGTLEIVERFDAGRWGFLFLRHRSGGSTSDWESRVVSLGALYGETDAAPDVREVPIERPAERLRDLLVGGRRATSCCLSLAGTGDLLFGFMIHASADPPNNFPTGGSVEGRLRLVSDSAGRPVRYEVASWEHVR